MEPPPPRTRVVLGEVSRARIRPARARAELEEQSPVGAALARGLVRAQLSVAVRLDRKSVV